ncbi:hypothetical protein [Micromonospora sp. NBC_00858]|uniref:hypothetical protein n=1 Tax=Micromonospora sp. NBC_00858 TaxID=2975979 RepID=UPI003868A0EF|nr:hypothetical protein OG990_30275 [Micromonospora sp. NBC_00858]
MTDQAELHDALLRLAGRIPDSMLVRARLRLADGKIDDTDDLQPLFDIPFTFTPAPPDSGTLGVSMPLVLDLVGQSLDDPMDEAARAAVAELPGSVALWRAWRTAPAWAALAMPPTRLYVVEADGVQPLVTATVMRALISAGIEEPLVETYRPGQELPQLTRLARGTAALLWTRAEAPPMRIARVFDVVDDDGARFDPAHERLDDADRARVAAYLNAGTTILMTTGRLNDVVEPQRGEVVPMSYRTDGRWLWTDSTTYYLREYGLAPEPDLLAAIRAAGPLLPAPDPADQHRALAAIFQSHAMAPIPTAK